MGLGPLICLPFGGLGFRLGVVFRPGLGLGVKREFSVPHNGSPGA